MTTALMLGEVALGDFEIPEHFAIGGKQHLVIHTLPGGGRVVDAMGGEDAPIRWSGVISGPSAAERVRVLDSLRRSGQRQILTWNAWRYLVIVQEFEAQIASSWWIPYRIVLCVTGSEPAAPADWLDDAAMPALSIGLLAAGALDAAIVSAGLGLALDDVGQAVGAAGSLAQLVTARAFGLVSA